MQSAITNMEIEALAKGIGINQKLDRLGLNLGCEYETIDAYKASNRSDAKVTYQGTRQMLKDWRDEITQEEQQRPILKKALKDAGLARLAEKYLGGKAAMGTGQAGRSETKTLSEPVSVHQSGGDQTINASGRSKVKGSTMTGTVKNMTVHNHPAEASTSQGQGRKGKAAGSSGVKKMSDESDQEEEDSDEGYVDHLGGELSILSHNVKLSIPPGALENSEKIRIEVFSDLPNGIDLQDNEIAASFGFRCFPSGLSFKKPLTLYMPHCAIIDDNEVMGMVLHFRSDDKGEIMRIPLESSKYVIHSDSIELKLDHFSLGFPTFISNWWKSGGNFESQSTKRMSCMPFIRETLPNDQNRSIMRVRVYNQLPGIRKDILAEEKSMKYKQINSEEELIVKEDSIDMSISCMSDELMSTQTKDFTAKELMQHNKLTAYMNLLKRRSFVTLIIRQERDLTMKFWTDIEGEVATGTRQAGRSDTETLSELVTVHQRGRDQTINASGRSTVEGNAITSVTINTGIHPAEASTSQSQGGKRKATAPSGSKKGAKMGGKR